MIDRQHLLKLKREAADIAAKIEELYKMETDACGVLSSDPWLKVEIEITSHHGVKTKVSFNNADQLCEFFAKGIEVLK